ncbi:hypothetical protein [Paenibacillus senegalensis]|uniref:hypothetical protein n=1 Tax=Paenibacillus senegalensis TaxID=1465766 RepID=UPI000288B8A5|nr:hypothetical protein [Paenibacillus senegalensis]
MSSNHQDKQMSGTLETIRHELNRIQTIAGTLGTLETKHFQDLTNAGDDRLNQIAVEEQSGARQLGEIKQLCLSLAQQIQELEGQIETRE